MSCIDLVFTDQPDIFMEVTQTISMDHVIKFVSSKGNVKVTKGYVRER